MKFALSLPLFLLCSCITTGEGYLTEREFPVQSPTLKVNIDYERELSEGEATKVSILNGLLAFGPSSQITILWFLKFGESNGVYSEGAAVPEGSAIEKLISLPLSPALALFGGDRMEEAAAYDALYPTGEHDAHVLGFPLYRSDVTDLFLIKWEKVTVEGFRGEVKSSQSTW